MISEDTTPTLATLQAEILELKRSVAELITLVSAVQPTPDRMDAAAPQPGNSFEDASQYVRSNFADLLQKLSQ